MTEPTEDQIEAFKEAWHSTAPGERVRAGLRAAFAVSGNPEPVGVGLTKTEVWEVLRRCPACGGLGCAGCEDILATVERIVAARQVPTVLAQPGVTRTIDRVRLRELLESRGLIQSGADWDVVVEAEFSHLVGILEEFINTEGDGS